MRCGETHLPQYPTLNSNANQSEQKSLQILCSWTRLLRTARDPGHFNEETRACKWGCFSCSGLKLYKSRGNRRVKSGWLKDRVECVSPSLPSSLLCFFSHSMFLLIASKYVSDLPGWPEKEGKKQKEDVKTVLFDALESGEQVDVPSLLLSYIRPRGEATLQQRVWQCFFTFINYVKD